MPTRVVISREEAARRIGLSVKTIDRLCLTHGLHKSGFRNAASGSLRAKLNGS